MIFFSESDVREQVGKERESQAFGLNTTALLTENFNIFPSTLLLSGEQAKSRIHLSPVKATESQYC